MTKTIFEFITGLKSFPLIVDLLDETQNKPFDLTTYDDIKCCFMKQDGTELMATLLTGEITILGNPILGTIQIQLEADQTVDLLPVDYETLWLQFIDNGDPTNPVGLKIDNAYSVLENGC